LRLADFLFQALVLLFILQAVLGRCYGIVFSLFDEVFLPNVFLSLFWLVAIGISFLHEKSKRDRFYTGAVLASGASTLSLLVGY
jgi:hypothetical protein